MAKAGWHKHADGTSGEVGTGGKQFCVPTATTAKLHLLSFFYILPTEVSVLWIVRVWGRREGISFG